MDISGFVVLGIVTLFLVYLMPQLIRSRQDVVDSRVDDRFSAELRILATAGAGGGPIPRPAIADGAPRAYLHHPRSRTEVAAMNRPLALVSRPPTSPASPDSPSGPSPVVQRSQAPRAAALAAAARRREAARRRLVLTLALVAVTVGAWATVAIGIAPPAVAALPTALLVGVLVLGRRAVRAGRQGIPVQAGVPTSRPAVIVGTTERPARTAEPDHETPALPATSRQHRPSRELSTEILPRVGASPAAGLSWSGEPTAPVVAEVPDGASAISQHQPTEVPRWAEPDAATAGTPRADAPDRAAERLRADVWTPVPVPAPTYTVKPVAPRMDTAPLVVERPTIQASVETPGGNVAAEPSLRSLDLDAVLSRRRAAGE